jgi:hypothetical protein
VEAMDKTEKNIKEFGWEAMYVFDEHAEKQPFLYTIGLEETYEHPEIMIFGLNRETMHNIVSDIVHDIKNGFKAPINIKTKGMLSGDFEVLFKPVQSQYLENYLGKAIQYYQKPFRALVMLWPDKNNTLPNENDCQVDVQDEALKIV